MAVDTAERRALAPIAVALGVMSFWGATPVITRLATADLEPLLVGVLRTLFAGILAAPILLATRAAPPPDPRGRVLLGISALSGFVAFPILYTLGQERTSAMHGAMILAGLPIVTGAYAAIVDRRRPTQRWLLGCGLALAGEFAIIALRAGHGGAEPTLAGDLLVILSALIVSSGYIAGARLGARGFKSLPTTFWGVVLGAIVVAPITAALLVGDGIPQAGAEAWGAVVFLAVVTSIVGYVGWYWALARGGIARIATLQFFQPFSGLVLAAVLLDERFTPALLLAAAAILVGVGIAQRT